MNNHSRALSFQDACIAVAKQILPINIDKNMIQTQKKRLNNTCKLSMFAREKSNSLHSCLVHFMEKSKVCVVAMQHQTCTKIFELNITFAL